METKQLEFFAKGDYTQADIEKWRNISEKIDKAPDGIFTHYRMVWDKHHLIMFGYDDVSVFEIISEHRGLVFGSHYFKLKDMQGKEMLIGYVPSYRSFGNYVEITEKTVLYSWKDGESYDFHEYTPPIND